MTRVGLSAATAAVLLMACGHAPAPSAGAGPARPSILLVTLDTTRADAIGPEAVGVHTPSFDAVAARGLRFTQAYAAVPETLPSHTSILTGLYPGGHNIHENGRTLNPSIPTAAERLHGAGYHTAAFVSAFVLARQFGLARGFEIYDDTFPAGASERPANLTTDRAIAELQRPSRGPRFLWVHYYDPHYPYAPPEPFRTLYARDPYRGEVAFVDQQLGRLLPAFDAAAPGGAVIIVADHGEGLGEHGEAQHGTLLYQATMHVPLVIAGPGVAAGQTSAVVSTRRVFHTILDWAGLGADHSLRQPDAHESALGEAMKPFLDYGWLPQVMAVDGHMKAIEAGRLETYDLAGDPHETHDLGGGANLAAAMRKSLDDYPIASPDAAQAKAPLDADARARLASLGYVNASAAPLVRKDAPRPADMVGLLPLIERGSGLFEAGQYAAAIPLLEQLHTKDPHNLDAVLRLATSYSSLGRNAQAEAAFQEAAAIAPDSPDVRVYLGLHYARLHDWKRAGPLLQAAAAAFPDRIPVLEALGAMAMDEGRTPDAVSAYEHVRQLQGAAFAHNLELGVLYLDARRFAEARDALDRVPSSSPDYPVALFKRAQVAVLLHEPDAAGRIEAARAHATPETRTLIARERLFQGVGK